MIGFHPFHVIRQNLGAFRFVMQLVQKSGINLERFGRSPQSPEIFFGNSAGGDLIGIPVSEKNRKIDRRRAHNFQRRTCRLQVESDRRKLVQQIEIFERVKMRLVARQSFRCGCRSESEDLESVRSFFAQRKAAIEAARKRALTREN